MRCQGTEDSLEEAIEDVAKVLELAGAEVVVNKIHIDSKEKAIQYRFESSPTIRINGKDIQLEIKESLCESCVDCAGMKWTVVYGCTKVKNTMFLQKQ